MISRVPEDTLHLSIVDQNAARCYIQTLQIFPFPEESHFEIAVEVLAQALWATLTKFPFLAGTIGPLDPETGKLTLRYPTEICDVKKAGLFSSKRLTYPDEFAHSYQHLKYAGMPPSCLKAETFCPDILRGHPGISPFAEGLMPLDHAVPVLAVQAFHIYGGLVLSLYVHHNVADCSGINEFWKHYAESVRHRRGFDSPSGVRVPNQSTLRSHLDARIPLLESPMADAYVLDRFEYSKTLNQTSPCCTKLFVISASRIRAFREKLKKSLKDDTKLTICNVLAALLWVHVTRARGKRLVEKGCSESSLGVAVDMRKRLTPPLSEDYMGAMALFAKATLPISNFLCEEIVTESTILSTALSINRTISQVDDAWVWRHLAFFKSRTPIKDTEPELKFRFGPDLYITSWMNFGADHIWNIPGTASGRPEYIRRTSERNADGGMTILPRRREIVDGKEAPYEMLVRLATEDMQRLEAEPSGLRSWAERVIE